MLQLIVLVLLLHLYMAWRLVPGMPFGLAGVVATILLLALSLSVLPFAEYARRNKNNPYADHLAGAGFLAMGFFSSILILTLLREVVLLAGLAATGLLIDAATFRQLRIGSAAAVPLLAVLITVVGFVNARRRASIRVVDVPIAGLPEALRGFSIVQITDIHVGATIKHGYVSRIVDAVNALEADMIAITGDLVDGSVGRLAAHTAPLERLSARCGTFFVTGNHEYYSGAHACIDRGFSPTTVRPYAWGTVFSLESCLEASGAVYRGVASPGRPLDLCKPRHWLLGAAQALWRAFRNYPSQAGARFGYWRTGGRKTAIG